MPFVPQSLSCLVQLASVRRSLFNTSERSKFLEQLVQGVKRILESPQVRLPHFLITLFCFFDVFNYLMLGNSQFSTIFCIESNDYVRLGITIVVSKTESRIQSKASNTHFKESTWTNGWISNPVRGIQNHKCKNQLHQLIDSGTQSRHSGIQNVESTNQHHLELPYYIYSTFTCENIGSGLYIIYPLSNIYKTFVSATPDQTLETKWKVAGNFEWIHDLPIYWNQKQLINIFLKWRCYV